MITCQTKTPDEISNCGDVIHRRDLDTIHDEADNSNIDAHGWRGRPQESWDNYVDAADVFVLLLHYYHKAGLTMNVTKS